MGDFGAHHGHTDRRHGAFCRNAAIEMAGLVGNAGDGCRRCRNVHDAELNQYHTD